MKKAVVGFALLWTIIVCRAGTIYVDDSAAGTNNGTNWVDAYKFLQDGLAAAVSGDLILVAQGIYQPDASAASPDGTGSRNATFTLKNGVTIQGGYAGTGYPDPNARDISAFATILSGDLNGNDGPNFTNNAENSFHVVTAESTNATAVLDGFTITAGNANGYYASFEDIGAGLYARNGTPTIIGCLFIRNYAKSGGGGVYTFGIGKKPTFMNCLFLGNEGGTRGGGMYNWYSSPALTNCVFSGNHAAQGGAIRNFQSQSMPTLINCTLFGNTAGSSGGIYNYSASSILKNCILWGNSDNGGTDESAQIEGGTLTISYSCLQGWTGTLGGTANNGNDPRFVDADGSDNTAGTEDDDLRLNSGSSCIDSADNTAVPAGITTDVAGNPRFLDDPDTDNTGNGTPPIVDRGAYEFSDPVVVLGAGPARIDFWILYGQTQIDPQILYIENTGGGTLNWQINEECPWLAAIPSQGSCTTGIDPSQILADCVGLGPGRYEDQLTVSGENALNSPQTIQIVLHVTEVPPSEYWRDTITFPNDPFKSEVISENDPGWVKFTMLLLPPYNPDSVYFQDSRAYLFHYDFATEFLTPFIGISRTEYNTVTLYAQGQQAALGAVIMPADPQIREYGIQLVRYNPYTKEETAALFAAVKASVQADPDVQAYYFPSYEQMAVAEVNQAWFEAQGIPIGSTARWALGNACYSSGWALGTLKYVPGSQIQAAYAAGTLLPEDILLTDGVPAEVPFLAGILSLSPSTPSSHVAILAQTFGIPFGHLALAEDANLAQQLIGRLVLISVGQEDGVGSIGIKDMTSLLTQEEIDQILALKAPPPLDITAMKPYGSYSENTDGLVPDDIRYFGGKAANYGILRRAIPDHCPKAVALSFDLWNEFLDQPLAPGDSVTIDPNGYVVFWADDQTAQGPMHTNFKLGKGGEDIGLFDVDGTSLIDGFSFTEQTTDVSYGRSPDGADTWVFFSGEDISPNAPNPGSGGGPDQGLFINEFMADNDAIAADEYGEYDDWIEIYNAGPTAIDLGGMYLTDDLNDPTKFMIAVGITGSTLREEISNRLGDYTYPPSDLAALSVDLAAVRNMITNARITSFSPQLQDAIIAVLQDPNYGFDPDSNIRFRSSTNVEDADRFSGAGLYDSYSGCLADDLDGDDSGPCICDPVESNERGVFRAIRKVFASFYNDNAFLERLRHGIDENEVGMGLLVHHSTPDEFELANGVAALERRPGDTNRYIKLVTQKGAVSVANPEDGSIPEEVNVLYESESEIEITLIRSSNLVILGETVLGWPEDYSELSQLLVAAAEEFEVVTGKTDYLLDYEYKKLSPGGAAMPGGGLEVKQIRQIPKSEPSMSVNTAFLVNEPVTYVTFQGEGGDVYSKHRLKCRWVLGTKSMWLTPDNLSQSFYGDVSLEYAADGRIRTLTGRLPLLPFASHTFGSTTATDNWTMHHLYNPRAYTLTTPYVKTQVGPAESPIVTLSDFGQTMQPGTNIKSLDVAVDYALPGEPTTDTIRISTELTDYLYQQRSFTSKGISVTTSFFYAFWESMILTYPLSHFIETRITGLTSQPIVLHGYYSQTFHPLHHNFGEEFLFEPRLEPGISQSILDQLAAADIDLIYFYADRMGGLPEISTFRSWDLPFLTADVDDDGDVDLSDLADLSLQWLDSVCDECEGADLTGDGRVNMDDFWEFAHEWLEEL